MDAIVACKTVLAVLVLFLIFLVQRITWFKVYIAATSFEKSVYLFIANVLPDLINLCFSIYLKWVCVRERARALVCVKITVYVHT